MPSPIEATRRNGARSRGPTTPEGEDPAELDALYTGLINELLPSTKPEAPPSGDEHRVARGW